MSSDPDNKKTHWHQLAVEIGAETPAESPPVEADAANSETPPPLPAPTMPDGKNDRPRANQNHVPTGKDWRENWGSTSTGANTPYPRRRRRPKTQQILAIRLQTRSRPQLPTI